jgi:hypothetical protein
MIKVWSCWRTRGLYPAHAVALAGEISGAQLVMIDQLGHVPAPASFPTILPAVLSGGLALLQPVHPGARDRQRR